MPIHDWTRVPAGIFHDFHHGWIEEAKRALNAQSRRTTMRWRNKRRLASGQTC